MTVALTGKITETTTRCVVIPIRTPSVANLREHWLDKARRTRDQRAITLALLLVQVGPLRQAPTLVRLVRVAPRPIDSDNAVAALKAIRDGVADFVGIDDGTLPFEYEQRVRGKAREVHIELVFLAGGGA